jgi:hypothetical protein
MVRILFIHSNTVISNTVDAGSAPPRKLCQNENIQIRYLATPWSLPADIPRLWFLLYAPFKVLFQILVLFWTLMFCCGSLSAILLQASIYLIFIYLLNCFIFIYSLFLLLLLSSLFYLFYLISVESSCHSYTDGGQIGRYHETMSCGH